MNTLRLQRGATALFVFLGLTLTACGTETAQSGTSDTTIGEADTGAEDDATTALPPCVGVVCDPANDTVCARNSCDSSTGACAMKPVLDGTSCDDGEACTLGDSCLAGKCVAGKASLCACKQDADCPNDDDKCNGALFCDKATLPWTCRLNNASVVTCPQSTDACTAISCNAATGKCDTTKLDDGQDCDDGDKCTVGDGCKGGKCAHTANTCKCQDEADCALNDDGNACNGTLFCNQATSKCEVNQATVIKCDKAEDSACIKNTCVPKTGICTLQAVPKNTACDDNEKCTSGDHCEGGVCAGGENTCVCKSNADCANNDDGNLCNGVQFCNQATGKCAFNPASIVHCAEVHDTACAKNVCQPTTGKCQVTERAVTKKVCKSDNSAPDGIKCSWQLKQKGEAGDPGPFPCDDGDQCTSGEACQGVTCKAAAITCLCKTNADCDGKDDGNLCNGTFYCDKSLKVADCVFNKASVVHCNPKDNTDCLKSVCDTKTGACGLAPLATSTNCDDGDPCTVGDKCGGGTCASGTDVCECHKDVDCAGKDDGNLCNGTWFCDKSGSKPQCNFNKASVVYCATQDDTDCLKNSCDAKTGKCGLVPAKSGEKCDDAKVCTVGDKCDGKGGCQSKANDCDDGNACTTDICVPDKGCAHTLKLCDDANGCTAEKCDAKTGACTTPVARPSGTACNADNDGCTAADTCDGKGSCKVGATVTCAESEKACQLNLCQSQGPHQFKCVLTNDKDGTTCDDDSCFVGSTCKAGKCVEGSVSGLFDVTLGPKTGRTAATGAARHKDGSYIVVGRQAQGAVNPVTDNRWYATRVSSAGKVVWSWKSTAVGSASTGAVGVSAQGAGASLLVGTALVGKEPRTGMAVLDENGKAVGSATFDVVPGYDEWVTDVDVMQDEGLVAVVRATASGKTTKHAVARLSDVGTVLWKYAVDVKVPGGKVAVLNNGDIAHTTLRTGPPAFPTVSRHGASGKLLSSLMLPTDGLVAYITNHQVLGMCARSSGGGFVYWLPFSGPSTTQPRQLVGFNAKGTYNFSQSLSLPAGGTVHHMAAHGDGFVMVGRITDAAGHKAWVRKHDSFGNPQWSRTFPGSHDAILHALSIPGGGLLLSGYAGDGKGPQQVSLRRINDWGHRSCAEAGVCGQKSASSCGDGTTCTADGCDPKKGCTYTTDDGAFCDPKTGCSSRGSCKAKACVALEPGRLFQANLGYKEVFSAVMHNAGTGYLTVGLRPGTHPIFRRPWDAFGKNSTLAAFGNACSTVQVKTGLLADPVRPIIKGRSSGSSYSARFCGVDQSALFTKTWYDRSIAPNCSGCRVEPIDAEMLIDGSRVHLGDTIGGHDGFAVDRYDPVKKKAHWTRHHAISGKGVRARGIGTLSDARTVVVGQIGSVNGPYGDGFAALLEENGTLKWQQTYKQNEPWVLVDAVQAQGGRIVVGGWRQVNATVKRRLLAGLELDGKVAWTVKPTLQNSFTTVEALIGGHGSDVAWFGIKQEAGSRTIVGGGVDNNGKELWTSTVRANTTLQLLPHTITRLKDRGFGIPANPSGGGGAWMLRTSSWGQPTCAAAGSCFLPKNDCDDAKSCTADICTPTGGCKHTPIAGVKCE